MKKPPSSSQSTPEADLWEQWRRHSANRWGIGQPTPSLLKWLQSSEPPN
ncbi:MAG: hypothetical protein QNJ46_03615 [Leptolyngbyaceae cyanobacterium MO_188.B28]|nr:hypothetical protein [Leptolyngbyaceae cyanobacterium MO_188.B28]